MFSCFRKPYDFEMRMGTNVIPSYLKNLFTILSQLYHYKGFEILAKVAPSSGDPSPSIYR